MRCKKGDLAEVIRSVDGLSVGKIVQVCFFQGYHTEYGPIWQCRSKDELVTEYGAVGNQADFPDDWLRPIKPPTNIESDIKKLEKVE